jgi:hypothetical protein
MSIAIILRSINFGGKGHNNIEIRTMVLRITYTNSECVLEEFLGIS